MTVMMNVTYQKLYKFAPVLMVGNVFLLLMVLVPGIGKMVNGGRRWIGTSSIHLQPSELAIVFTALYLAFFFTKKVTVLRNFKRGLRPALFMLIINFALIYKEPDMGTALTLAGTALAVMFASGVPLKRLFTLLAVAIPLIGVLSMMESYRTSRMLVFLDMFSKSHADTAYQLLQGLTAITSGGWFGRGFDMSIEKTGYLPEPHTDFIFTVFVEEWGIVGGIALLIIFSVLLWRGFSIARRASNRFGALLSVGLVSMITIKTFINLGAVTAVLPVTGIPLPFISYGGTSLIVNLIAMGILLNISRFCYDQDVEADNLADVVPVEDIIEERQALERKRERLQSNPRPAAQKTGQVHKLRPRVEDRNHTDSSWRTRQTERKQSETRRTDRRDVASPSSWRARNQQSDSWRGTPKKGGRK